MSANHSCLCSKQIKFSSSTPIITDRKNVFNFDENHSSTPTPNITDRKNLFNFSENHSSPLGNSISQIPDSSKKQHLFGQVKYLIDFNSDEYETKFINSQQKISESHYQTATTCKSHFEHGSNGSINQDNSASLISVNAIVEQFTAKRIKDQTIHCDELRKISLDHSKKLKYKDEEIDFLIKETYGITDLLHKTIEEKDQLEIQFKEQSKLEESILEENQVLRIDIAKKEIKSKDEIRNLVEENGALIKMHEELKNELEKREREAEVLRLSRDEEADMNKSQIENLQAILVIAKFKLAKANGQFKKVLMDKAVVKFKNLLKDKKDESLHLPEKEVFCESENQDKTLVRNEKENFLLRQSNFHSFCESEKERLSKDEIKLKQEKRDLLRKQSLIEAKLKEIENEKNNFLLPVLFCGILVGSVFFIYKRNIQ